MNKALILSNEWQKDRQTDICIPWATFVAKQVVFVSTQFECNLSTGQLE